MITASLDLVKIKKECACCIVKRESERVWSQRYQTFLCLQLLKSCKWALWSHIQNQPERSSLSLRVQLKMPSAEGRLLLPQTDGAFLVVFPAHITLLHKHRATDWHIDSDTQCHVHSTPFCLCAFSLLLQSMWLLVSFSVFCTSSPLLSLRYACVSVCVCVCVVWSQWQCLQVNQSQDENRVQRGLKGHEKDSATPPTPAAAPP